MLLRDGRFGLSTIVLAVLLCQLAACATSRAGQTSESPGNFERVSAGFKVQKGLLEVYSDARSARVLLGVRADAQGVCGEFLYRSAIRTGLGSNPVGIDRAAPGETRILRLRRVGMKVLMEFENAGFNAAQGSAEEKQAVRESFPPSIIWSGEVLAERADGVSLVDISSFLTRDAFDVVGKLKEARQGDFKLATELSYPDVAALHVLPDNLEFDAYETFTSEAPGEEIKGIVPDPHALTLVEHHTLVRLPPAGYEPRVADPRAGSFDTLAIDYSSPLSAPVARRLATRFRLEKTDPTAARSKVRKPIVFYVDRAAPEPIRSALIDGARWWADAFEAAGFIDAFRVELLPADVDPLDIRYNVIHWAHRQTRGWSYGYGMVDPRTGEIVGGSVVLGSLRVRQDQLIFEGLVGADRSGTGASDDPTAAALARLRQLAVHEVGHVLGLEHNFAGSSFDDRASVMDYPFPRIGINDGRLDFADAYKVGIGSWDRFAIRWLYGTVPPGAAGQAALEQQVREGYAQGLRFVSGENAPGSGSSNPHGALFDDGADPLAHLEHVLAVRALALQHFGPGNLAAGAPMSELRRVIVPVYLFHRYAVAAAAKSIGGVDSSYALRGDALPGAHPVDAATQRKALAAVLATLDPARLTLPDTLIDQLSQGRNGTDDRQYEIELFGDPASGVFSLDAAAAAATDVVMTELLDPDRLARVNDQHQRDAAQIGVQNLLQQVLDSVFPLQPPGGRPGQVQRTAARRTFVRMAALLQDRRLTPAVGNAVHAALERLAQRLQLQRNGSPEDLAQAKFLSDTVLIRSYDRLAELAQEAKAVYAPVPPGMPIGSSAGSTEDMCWFCDLGAGLRGRLRAPTPR